MGGTVLFGRSDKSGKLLPDLPGDIPVAMPGLVVDVDLPADTAAVTAFSGDALEPGCVIRHKKLRLILVHVRPSKEKCIAAGGFLQQNKIETARGCEYNNGA